MPSKLEHRPRKDFEYSTEFDVHAKEIEKDIRVLDEILRQIEWAIGRDATIYPFSSERAKIRVIKSSSFRGKPSVSIYFKEHAEKYVFIDIFVNEE